MITRGHFIGEIIDELSTIGSQVAMRNQLGYMDLTKFAEDFFKDLLNCIHDWRLVNLNATRSNEPGLDLGDKGAKVAVQVTATPTLAKVKDTIRNITDDQQKDYPERVIVFVIGTKQRTYEWENWGLELTAKREKLGFTVNNIWDNTDIARMIVNLDIDVLSKLHSLLRKNVVKLRIELEVPDTSGTYPTSGYDKWEPRGVPKVGACEKFIALDEKFGDYVMPEEQRADIKKAIKDLADRLSAMPRITREFLAMLLANRITDNKMESLFVTANHGTDLHQFLLAKIARKLYRDDDFDSEMEILNYMGFAQLERGEVNEAVVEQIGILLSKLSTTLCMNFFPFIEENQLDLRKVIGEMYFSDF